MQAKIPDKSLKTFGLVLLGLLLSWPRLAHGLPDWDTPLQSPKQDVAFFEIEPYRGFGDPAPTYYSSRQFWRYAGQISFPAGSIAGHDLFGSAKSTFIGRDIGYQGKILNQGSLQRYWLAFGGTAFTTEKQNGTVVVGLGHNSDGYDFSAPGWNTEWIYMHSFAVNERLEWGLGADVQQYFDQFIPYPLIFLDWRVAAATKLRWDADYLEVRQFLRPNLSLAAGVRFNLEFFNLGESGTYEYQSVGGEIGLQYAFSTHGYLRLNFKRLFAGQEEIGLPEGGLHKRDVPAGSSLRLNAAFGL